MGAEPGDVPAPAVSSSPGRLPEWITSERTLELAATLLLAFASLGTAWSAYQSRQWSGEQAAQTARATAARISVNRASALASRQLQIDVATFIQWINAREEHRPAVAAFYAARFRPEFKPAFDAWIATRPFTNKAAPLTPFALRAYRLQASRQAAGLEAAGAAQSQLATKADEHGDNYMLAVVLFASALFFAGISTKLEIRGMRAALLGLGWIVFLGTIVWLATLPVQLTT